MGKERSSYRLLVGKPEGWRSLGSLRYKWNDNIKIEKQDGVVWNGLIWLRMETRGRAL
jgi:hypothetical protein